MRSATPRDWTRKGRLRRFSLFGSEKSQDSGCRPDLHGLHSLSRMVAANGCLACASTRRTVPAPTWPSGAASRRSLRMTKPAPRNSSNVHTYPPPVASARVRRNRSSRPASMNAPSSFRVRCQTSVRRGFRQCPVTDQATLYRIERHLEQLVTQIGVNQPFPFERVDHAGIACPQTAARLDRRPPGLSKSPVPQLCLSI